MYSYRMTTVGHSTVLANDAYPGKCFSHFARSRCNARSFPRPVCLLLPRVASIDEKHIGERCENSHVYLNSKTGVQGLIFQSLSNLERIEYK
jgi:hypothetical protein